MSDIVIMVSGAPGPQGPAPTLAGVIANGANMTALNCTYAADASAAAQDLYLPDITTVPDGDWIEVDDAMGAAATHTITVHAHGGDQIVDHGVSAGTHAITNANTITRYRKRNGAWRVTQYGA